MNIDPQIVSDSLVFFLQDVFKKTNMSKAIVGVSGGIDSAVSLALAAKALGPDSVCPYLLPYGTINPQGVTDALLAIKHCEIPSNNVTQIDIQPSVDSIASVDPAINDVRKGNIMARIRMIFLFDAAKKNGGLVVGTENKSEHYLGYYTRFGDEASDVEPLRNLYKTQVYQLAEFLQIPQPIITKPPTAGLWEGQTDEKELGFSYKDADEILYYLEQQNDDIEISKMSIPLSIVKLVIARKHSQSFKHSLPFTL